MNRPTDETSTALLEAAHRLLAENGPEALTVRRIATEAGMSTMNVYSRFGGKDGVIDELYVDGYQRLQACLDAVPVTDDIASDLALVAEAYRNFAIDNPTYYGIMFRSAINGFEPSADAARVGLGALDAFTRRVEIGQESGQFIDPDGCSSIDIGAWLWATCHGFVSLELDNIAAGRVNWPEIFADGIRTTLISLSSTAGQTRSS